MLQQLGFLANSLGGAGQASHPMFFPLSEHTIAKEISPKAMGVIALGTCASYGGLPAAAPNPTGAKGLMHFLGKDYRSALGLPVINVSGCLSL